MSFAKEVHALRSPDPRVRRRSLLVGILRYADSRLGPTAYQEFLNQARSLGLPISADEGFESHDLNELSILVSLLLGTLPAVEDATIDRFGLHVGSTTVTGATVVSGDVEAVGASQIAGDSSVGAVEIKGFDASTAAQLTASGGVSVPNGGVVAEVAAAGLFDHNPKEVYSEGVLAGGHLGLHQQRPLGEVIEGLPVEDRGVFFEDQAGALQYVKAGDTALPGERFVTVSRDGMFDSGWQRLVAHDVGDTATNPPYEETYPLNVAVPFGAPGDRLGIVDTQVFLRSPPITATDGQALPGSHSGSVTCMTQVFGSLRSGIGVMIDQAGQLRIRIGRESRVDQRFTHAEFRVLIWFRGTE